MLLKVALAFSAAVLSVSISVWLLAVYPRQRDRMADEMRAARAPALDEYRTCTIASGDVFSSRWARACKTKSTKAKEECRIDAMCVHDTFATGSETCVTRKYGSDVKLDPDAIRARCDAAFPYDADCFLDETGARLNAQWVSNMAECRDQFDVHMAGYLDRQGIAR